MDGAEKEAVVKVGVIAGWLKNDYPTTVAVIYRDNVGVVGIDAAIIDGTAWEAPGAQFSAHRHVQCLRNEDYAAKLANGPLTIDTKTLNSFGQITCTPQKPGIIGYHTQTQLLLGRQAWHAYESLGETEWQELGRQHWSRGQEWQSNHNWTWLPQEIAISAASRKGNGEGLYTDISVLLNS